MKFMLRVANEKYKYWVEKLTELGFSISKKREVLNNDYDCVRYFIEVSDLQSLLKIVNEEDIIIESEDYNEYKCPVITIYNYLVEQREQS